MTNLPPSECKATSGDTYPKVRRYVLEDGILRFTWLNVTWYFFLNNQPHALIIKILLCYKTLHVSGIFSAHHQEFSTVHSALVSFMQVFDDRFQAESGWNCRSIPILFCYKTLHVSGIFSAHHQEFSTVHSALVSFMQIFDDRFQAESITS